MINRTRAALRNAPGPGFERLFLHVFEQYRSAQLQAPAVLAMQARQRRAVTPQTCAGTAGSLHWRARPLSRKKSRAGGSCICCPTCVGW
jgi:hypothetical protein